MKKVIIGLLVLIFIGITLISWVGGVSFILILLTIASRIKTYQSVKWLTFPKVFYVVTIRHIVVLLSAISLIVPIYMVVTGEVLSLFNMCIYLTVLICTLLGIDFCLRISKAPVYTENGLEILITIEKRKVTYTKLVLTECINSHEFIAYIPREENYKEVCILYVDFNENIIDEEGSEILFKNIANNAGVGFSTLKFQYDEDLSITYKREYIKEYIKCLKKEMDFEKVIIVSSSNDAKKLLALGLRNKYKDINEQLDGVIALYPNVDMITVGEKNPEILMIYGSHNNIIDVNNIRSFIDNMRKSGKGICYLELPGAGQSSDDFCFKNSIVGCKVNKEIINWLRSNFL